MKAAVQVLKQAEDLKAKVSGDILNDNEAWTSHQKLQDLYQQLLVMDLEYALDKKVEQDLWNHVFKNQINALQSQAKDKKNPRRTESQGNLAWFLESASGFYLQLLQELCDAFDLDLPCRRKGSVYGIIKGSKTVKCNITPPQKSSCLYVCQHCLVHLGDIARYRNQSLQAETFYRHAAQLVPSNGQPYNQLAILEAAKGEKLSMVFYYVRSIAVKHPFPVASTNLQKIFAKITGDDLNIEGKAKVSVYDYINTFLQFHSLVHMTSDLVRAEKLLKVLASNLSTLIATESLSSWKLIQMIAINLFAVAHATRTLEVQDKKENGSDGGSSNSEPLSDEETRVYNLMLELLASVLNGILLLVYTMKDENTFKDYYALPVVKLILDWVQQDLEILHSQPFANKLQIWPSLCKLLNGIQFGVTDNFDATKYEDVPLPEDWDLQCFLPLSKVHKQFKFKEATPRLTEEEETKLRTHRLINHGIWICDQEVSGKKLMTVRDWTGEGNCRTLTFEAIIQQAPSSEVLLQLEEVSVSKGSRNGHLFVETFADSSSNSVGSQETTAQAQDTRSDSSDFGGAHVKPAVEKSYQNERDKVSQGVMKDKANKPENGKVSSSSPWSSLDDRTKEKRTVAIEKASGSGGDRKENSRPTMYGRERKLRQNVAMQTIMQKKYPIPKGEALADVNLSTKPKVESKQVTFKTPSPSPPASSDGTPPQTSTPPQPALQTNSHLPCIDSMLSTFPPLQSVYQQMPSANSFVAPGQQQKAIGFNMQQVPANRMTMNFAGTLQNQNSALQDPISAAASGYTPARLVYPSLPTTSGPAAAFNSHVFNQPPQQAPPSAEYHPIPLPPQQSQSQANQFCNQMKDVTTAMNLKQPGNSNVNPQQQNPVPAPPPSFIYSQQMSPAQQKQAFTFAEPSAPSLYGQQVQWFQPPPPQIKDPTFFNTSQTGNVNPVAPQLQALSPGGYHHPMYATGQPAVQARNPMSENVVFQLQATPPSAYSYSVQVAPPVTPAKTAELSSLSSVIGGNASEKINATSASGRLDGDAGNGNSGGGEMITNTYSLFNSPWSSGLNSVGSNNEENFGVSLTTSSAPTSSGSSNFGSFMQPALQSLWSGPGPSPLERLLEQQKQKRDTAPQ